MRGEILGIERRRRWDDEGKLAIVRAFGVRGASVTQVAQRHEVTRQQIYAWRGVAWRGELKRKGLWSSDAGALFLPVGVTPVVGLPVSSAPPPVSWIELRLAKGRMLRFESGIDDRDLTRLIRAVDGA